MKLYDKSISTITGLLGEKADGSYPYDPSSAWPDNGHQELVLLRDAAYELGCDQKQSVNSTCVTTTPGIVTEDSVEVFGKDLPDIKSDVSFARIAILEIEDPGEDEDAYNAIKDLEFVRYNVFPTGYMSRISSENNKEKVRISKKAVASGITFQKVGQSYLKKYKSMPGVKHVKIIFATDPPKMDELISEAKKVSEITSTLTHIMDGIPTDCSHCDLKAVCDTVDGIREMHMKQKKKDHQRMLEEED